MMRSKLRSRRVREKRSQSSSLFHTSRCAQVHVCGRDPHVCICLLTVTLCSSWPWGLVLNLQVAWKVYLLNVPGSSCQLTTRNWKSCASQRKHPYREGHLNSQEIPLFVSLLNVASLHLSKVHTCVGICVQTRCTATGPTHPKPLCRPQLGSNHVPLASTTASLYCYCPTCSSSALQTSWTTCCWW